MKKEEKKKKPEKKYSIDKMDPSSFGYRRWEAGTIHEIINAPCRYQYIVKEREALRKYAIGWCDGEHVSYKPKHEEKAIMCFKDGRHFWFHIRNNEFEEVFSKRRKPRWELDTI